MFYMVLGMPLLYHQGPYPFQVFFQPFHVLVQSPEAFGAGSGQYLRHIW